MGLKIRNAKPEDKPYVLEFTKRTWEDWEEGDYIKYVWDEWIRDKNSIFLSAELNGRVVGILRLRFLPDGSGWLEGLRVDPGYRRRGIAIELNRAIIKRASSRGVNIFRGAIHEENEPSLRLAKKLGFSFHERNWVTLHLKDLKCLDGKCLDLVDCNDIEQIWSIIRNSKYYKFGGGLISLNWAWFKLNKEILVDLLNQKILSCSTTSSGEILALHRIRVRRNGKRILELVLFTGDDIFYIVNCLKKKFERDIDGVWLVYPEDLLDEKIFEKCEHEIERWFIFEYKI